VVGNKVSVVFRKRFLPWFPIFGSITFAVLLYVVLSDKHHIYHWLDTAAVAKDPVLSGKSGFLNAKFFIIVDDLDYWFLEFPWLENALVKQ
jgi:hypothetical protein